MKPLQLAIEMTEDEKARFASIFSAIGDGVSIQDTDFKILYQNDVHIGFIGDHAGEYCYKAYEKRKQVCEGCPVDKTFKDGMIHTAERTAPTDRGVLCFEITASPLKDSKGKIIAGIEVVRDITERKKMVEELRESEERFCQLADNLDEVFWLMDAKKNQMLYINPVYEKIWGRPHESLYNQPVSWIESVHPEDREYVNDAFERQFRGERQFDEEYRIIRPDKSVRWIWARTFTILNESGEVYRVAGIAKDITERKKSDEKLNKKIKELEKWQRLTVGREGRMVELKKEVEKLNKEIKELKIRLKKQEGTSNLNNAIS